MSNRFRFEAETRLIRWGESSSAGRTITLELPPDDGAAHPFRGFPTGHTQGQRFRMQFDAIDDSEQVAPPNSPADPQPETEKGCHTEAKPTTAGESKERRPWDELRPSQQAGILCSDRAFQQFASIRLGWACTNEEDAAAWLRAELDINSRRELDLRPDLAPKLNELRANFLEWAGRVSVPVR